MRRRLRQESVWKTEARAAVAAGGRLLLAPSASELRRAADLRAALRSEPF